MPDMGKMLFKESKSGSNEISDDVKEQVVRFYGRDDISRQAPGKRDVKSVKNKDSGKRDLIQKRHMLLTIGEAYYLFTKENESIKIKKSKFYDLRPEHVLPVSQMPHNVCVCKYHANFDFFIQAVKNVVQGFPASGRELLKFLCCDVDSEKCMTGYCLDCENNIESLIGEIEVDSFVTWKQWQEVDGFHKVILSDGSVEDVLKELKSQLDYYKIHCFVKTIQSDYFETQRRFVAPNECILQIDFSENFSAVSQDEIQSAHWSHQQVTIFTSCAWLHDNTARPIAVISDELSHDKFAVWVFLRTVIQTLKYEFPGLEKVQIFSDGCAAQFKNRYTIMNLCYMKEDFGVTGEWNFFATSHGKGAVDGIGGTIKRKVWTQVKCRAAVINSAHDFYQCVKDKVSGITIVLVSTGDIDKWRPLLGNRWKNSLAIPSLLSRHHFKAQDQSHVMVGRTARSAPRIVRVQDVPVAAMD